jgi:hypothetical protein
LNKRTVEFKNGVAEAAPIFIVNVILKKKEYCDNKLNYELLVNNIASLD